MKELTRHIEALLLENDCVILPHFGGFVTNHAPARWIEEEHLLLPPYRTIGFNAQLKINDGLLVQSYMQTHDATYPEATRLVESAIDRLSEELYKEGRVELYGIGVLHRTIEGDYSFEPAESGVITPSLYGFGSLEIKTLEQLSAEEDKAAEVTTSEPEADVPPVRSIIENRDHTLTIKIRHEWIANAVAAAAAILLFFILSTPVDNTYIEEENYASLGSVNVFDQVKGESLITTLLETTRPVVPTVAATPRQTKSESPVTKAEHPAIKAEAPVAAHATVASEKPVAAQPEAPATEQPAAKATPAAQPEKPATTPAKPAAKTPTVTYNIIVASVGSESDAEQAIKEFADKGQPGAFLIKGNGRFRIAIAAYESEAEAYRKANELKQDPMYKDAWVLKNRK